MDKKKVLLIDDEADFVMIMGKRIEHWGYELLTASSGKEGLEAVGQKHPDVVVLDYMMPEMDGVATLKEIRKVNKEIPVIMLTAFPNKASIEGTEKLGVSAYIPKLGMFGSVEASLRAAVEMTFEK